MTDEAPTAPAAALLVGAAAIEKGQPPEVVLSRVAQENPRAQARAADGARRRDERARALEELMRTRFGVAPDAANGGPLVDASKHFELARVLKEALGYVLYVTTCATHFPEHFEIATVLRTVGAGSHDARWRVRVPVASPMLDSLVPLFAGADWQEREQYDLLGVRFAGHPDLRRLMLPDEWEGHPLRRDYPIDTRVPPWR